MAKAPKRRKDERGRVSVGQAENLRDNLLPAPSSQDVNKPRMPFKTALVLTREQEDNLCEVAHRRIEQLSDQLGRTGDEGNYGGRTSRQKSVEIQNPESFFGKRKKFSRTYYGHLEYRKKPKTIYQHSNLSGPIAQRITMQMIARSIRFFLGQPDDIDWFSTQAVGEEDINQSEKIKRHSRWKIDQCGVKTRFTEGLEYAFIRGEAVIKPTHQQRFQIYKRSASVLMGGKDPNDPEGQMNLELPLLDANGDYIVEGDVFVPQMQPPPPPEPFVQGPAPGMPVGEVTQGTQPILEQPAAPAGPVPTGKMILRRDGVTELPQDPIYKPQVITRQLITFEGPEAPVVFFEDFLCPESATDVQTADLICHLYDMDIMKVAAMFRGNFGEGDEALENIQAAVERLREMSSETNLPKSAAKQPKADFKESDTSGAVGTPQCQLAECYMTYDADGDGIQEEIMLVLDRRNKAPIYYEYVANVTVRGLRPFYVWRPMPVDQRWYGMGSMELFDAEQEFCDLQINRYNFAKGKSGRVDFWNPAATMEGTRDPHLRLNHGKTYTLRDGKKVEDAYGFVEIPFDGEKLDYLLNLFMQMMQLKSGVINSGDQEMSGLPSSDLATGINEIRDSGDELFSRMLSHLYPGMKDTLKAVVEIIYANMNRPEVFTFFNGEADEILTLTPEDVRDMALNVTFELSHSQQRKAMEMGQLGQGTIDWFYGKAPELQARLAPFAQKLLRAYGVAQVDRIIVPMQPQLPSPPIDKPSAVGNALAALIKAGVLISEDDINGFLQKAGLPLLAGGPHPAAPPPPPPALTAPGAQDQEEEPLQVAV